MVFVNNFYVENVLKLVSRRHGKYILEQNINWVTFAQAAERYFGNQRCMSFVRIDLEKLNTL
jgi:fructose-1,6-bisphosphatase